MPAVYRAWRLFEEGSLSRWEVEARLLAGESTPAIAAKSGLPAEVIDAFHDLFFSVRPRLHARDWVVNRVLGAEARLGLQESSTAGLLRLYGFLGGPLIVDDLLDFFARPPVMPKTLAGLSEEALADLRHRLAIKAALQARTLRVGEGDLPRLLMLRDRCADGRRNGDEEASALVDRALPPSPLAPTRAAPQVGVPAQQPDTGADISFLPPWERAA
jgi:hypothetical protein